MPPYPLNLELAALPDGKYQIAMHLPSGDISRVFAVSQFRRYEVDACFEILSGLKHNVTPLEESKIIRQFGLKLFNFLIGDHPLIYAKYLDSLHHQYSIRLTLALENAIQLAYLPWELMRDRERDFLALSSSVSIVRIAPELQIGVPVPVIFPFRVLVIMATRNGERDWRQLAEATAALQQSGHLKLDRLHPTSQASLRLHLLAEDYHAIHYIGSSQPPPPNTPSTDDLSHEYYPESTLRLLVVTHTPVSTPTRGRFPAMVTLQFPMGRPAIDLFLREFYSALLGGLSVDNAMSQGRRAIANQFHTGEWAAPILVTHPQTSVLFRPVSNSGALPK